jgi:hypothetical protein
MTRSMTPKRSHTLFHADFLQRWDILVLDNASIHVGGENTNLGDWLRDGLSTWNEQPLRIPLLLLPARSP